MVGPVIGFAGAICAFGLVWHIWWMAIFGFGGRCAGRAVIGRSFVRDTRRTIPAAEVKAADRRWLMAAAASRLSRVNSRRRRLIVVSRN